MRYGIQENENGIICVNCANIISKNGQINQNYCSNCGNPLTEKAIKDYQKREREQEKEIFYSLKDISELENTDSLKKCMKKYFEEQK